MQWKVPEHSVEAHGAEPLSTVAFAALRHELWSQRVVAHSARRHIL